MIAADIMIIGILTIDFIIAENNSLKDKRHIVKSLLDTIRSRYNVSASEIGELDKLRRSVIGIACVSNCRDIVDSMLNKIIEIVESDPRIEIKENQVEIL